jgi:hypothetical protein
MAVYPLRKAVRAAEIAEEKAQFIARQFISSRPTTPNGLRALSVEIDDMNAGFAWSDAIAARVAASRALEQGHAKELLAEVAHQAAWKALVSASQESVALDNDAEFMRRFAARVAAADLWRNGDRVHWDPHETEHKQEPTLFVMHDWLANGITRGWFGLEDWYDGEERRVRALS